MVSTHDAGAEGDVEIDGALVAGEGLAEVELLTDELEEDEGAADVPPPQAATTPALTSVRADRRARRGCEVTLRRYGGWGATSSSSPWLSTGPGREDRAMGAQCGSITRAGQWGMALPLAPIPVLLDVDTGIDDACALLLAALHPGLDLRGVTCAGGNAPLTDVVRNTLTVLEAAGRTDTPVAVGASRPLLERPVDARHVHGADGMGDLGMPSPTLALDPRHAVSLLRDLVDEGAASGTPVTLVPLAPMTNIALFARTHPESFARLGRLVFMGGGAMVSNATAAAEFNVFHDPEAAAIVLDACAEHGVPAMMYGLDVFYAPTVTAAQASTLAAADSSAARLAGALIDFACRRFDSDTATIGDAGAVAALLRPDAVTTQRLPVRLELSGTWTRGRTIVDLRDWAGDMDHDPHGLAEAVIDVALAIDGDVISDLWLRTVGGES